MLLCLQGYLSNHQYISACWVSKGSGGKVQEMKGCCAHSCRRGGSFILVKAVRGGMPMLCYVMMFIRSTGCLQLKDCSVIHFHTTAADGAEHEQPTDRCFPKQIYATLMHTETHPLAQLHPHLPTHVHMYPHTPYFASGLPSPSCEDSLCR